MPRLIIDRVLQYRHRALSASIARMLPDKTTLLPWIRRQEQDLIEGVTLNPVLKPNPPTSLTLNITAHFKQNSVLATRIVSSFFVAPCSPILVVESKIFIQHECPMMGHHFDQCNMCRWTPRRCKDSNHIIIWLSTKGYPCCTHAQHANIFVH